MGKFKFKKIIFVIILIILIIVFLIGGYYTYQFFLVPKITKLSPSLFYPSSVCYKIAITEIKGTMTKVGDKKISFPQVTDIVEKDMRMIKEAGFKGIKLNFYFKTNNDYIVNRIALHAAKYGLYTIGVLQGNPNRSRAQAFTKDEIKEWQEYVKTQVRKNKNIIYFWEIWNEPSIDLFKYGTPEEYVDLLKATYPIIKKENPQAQVIVTLSAEAKDKTGFEEAVLSLGGGDYFDILSFHPYGANPYMQEELISEAIAKEKILVNKYNNRWPLIIGEIGQPISEVSEEEQARLAKFLYTKAKENDIPITWYYWSDEYLPRNYEGTGGGSNWGLVRYDGAARPALKIIKEFLIE